MNLHPFSDIARYLKVNKNNLFKKLEAQVYRLFSNSLRKKSLKWTILAFILFHETSIENLSQQNLLIFLLECRQNLARLIRKCTCTKQRTFISNIHLKVEKNLKKLEKKVNAPSFLVTTKSIVSNVRVISPKNLKANLATIVQESIEEFGILLWLILEMSKMK